VQRSRGLVIALGIAILGVIAMLLGVYVYLPGYIEKRVVAEARARGIELTPGKIAFGWQWVRLSGAAAKLIGAPSFEAKLGLVDVQLQSFEPVQVQVSDAQVGVSGTLPRVLLELGEWAKNHPEAFRAPLIANKVSIKVAEAPAEAPWLTLSGGFLTRTLAGGAFSAESCNLSGFELGKVGAGFAATGGDVSIGFGDQKAQAAPLRLDASLDESGAGNMRVALTPTKLGLLGKGLGIPLPLPDVVVTANVQLALPATALEGGAITGNLSTGLKGFVPPHPPELDGFVFGDVTTFDTGISIVGADRQVVTLSPARLKAGKFELHGKGTVTRVGLDANIDMDLSGNLPCDALAGAAAESRLGQLLGRASAKQGKRTAEALVVGTVSVEVGIKASTKDLLHAKLTQKIGVGCGLRPLTVTELVALTPNVNDLQAIGGELGKKMQDIGKNLGLPPVPTALALPPLPGFEPKAPAPGPSKKSP